MQIKGSYFTITTPKFCAACGHELHITKDQYTRHDWNQGVSHSCSCGTQFIQIDEKEDLSERVQKELDSY